MKGREKIDFSRTVNKEKRNGRTEKNSFIDEIVRELCGWNETNGIAQDYWNILRLHKEEQVTVVEYEGGYHIFKGKIDLCIGGSPCQDFSRANSVRDGLQGMKSMLFYEYIRLLEETKPKYYLLENVIMDDIGYSTISDLLGTEPVRLCGSKVSGALRDRLFWTNIGPESFDLFGNRKSAIPQPRDKKILLNDVLEYGYSDKRKHTCLNTNCGRDANQRYMLHRYATTGMTTIIYTDETMDESKGVRYCTQTELEKLHNIPVGYTKNLNKAQAGNLIGDGWNVGIVEHIFSFMQLT